MKGSPKQLCRAVIVLGMHRSGTSALARVLNLLGVDLSPHLVEPGKHNQTGYWEHQDIYLANEALLKNLNSSWDDIRSLPEGWVHSNVAEKYQLEIMSILDRDFNGISFWGVKDPRLCRLLPLWHSILEDTSNQPFFICIVRNPLEVVSSLAERDSFPKGKSCILWLRHLLEAEKSTRDKSRAFVTYDELLSDWKGAASRIERIFGFTWPVDLKKAGQRIESFLQDSLRHNRVKDTVLLNDKTLSRWVRDAYLAVKEASNGNGGELSKCLDSIDGELKQVESLYDPAYTFIWDKYQDEARVLQERNQQIKELNTTLLELHQKRGYDLATVEHLEKRVKEREDRILALEKSLAASEEARSRSEQALAARDAELERQQAEIEEKSLLLAEKERETADLRNALAASRDAVAEHQWELDKLRGAIGEKEVLIHELNIEVGMLRDKVDSLENEIERFRVDREAILSSTSWKLTAPVRWSKLKAKWVRSVIGGLPYFFKRHYWAFKRRYWAIKRSSLFDRTYYLQQNPDVAESGIDPLIHYLKFGAYEGRDPHPLFDSSYYLAQNPDVAEAGVNPLFHFIEFGANEGRQPKPRISMVLELKRAAGTNSDRLKAAARYIDERLKRHLITKFPDSWRLVYDKSRLVSPEPDDLETIDIIVTCHNAIEDLKACLHLITRTTPSINELILVDDGSEPETAEYVRKFSEVHKAKYIRNEQACGHPTAATQGLQVSTGDIVIVLNADTLPTKGWADKILACANSDKRIGIVGVLASTASWQSVPRVFDEDGDWAINPIPSDITLSQFANLLDRHPARLYPKLPFINGFCFAIKRKLMKDIGLFDYETFPHYGEENDYCLRAVKRGWLCAVADNAYLYHKQGKGYTNELRLVYAKRADENLIAKHDGELISRFAWSCRQSLKMAGLRAWSRSVVDRFRLVREGVRRFGGRRVSFILPAVDGGGVAVVMQEALCMAKMGVLVEILNLEGFRNDFIDANNIAESPVHIRFFDGQDALVEYLQKSSNEIDAVICTHHATVHWLAGLDLSSIKYKIGYYVQDYEPDFFRAGSPEHDLAKRSYTLIPGIKGFTKTHWTRDKLLKEVGLSATVIGPSVDLDLFRPAKEKNYFRPDEKVIVTAMVRPQTPRRAPEMTYKVLKTVAEHFPGQAEVYSFGCSDEELRECVGTPSELVTHLGVLDRKDMAVVLCETEIYLDASTFQAMGLTALEAMACGCEVVVPKNGGAIEFAEDRVNSIVVDTTDCVMMVDKVADLISKRDYREKLQLNAIRDANKYFPEQAAYSLLNAMFEQHTTTP